MNAKDLTPLAQSYREMLATPHNTIAGDRMRAMMQRDPGPVRRARTLMDTSHRYLLEDDFTEAAARVSMLEPRTLLKAVASCRMPFDTMWIEWNDNVRRQHTIDGSEFPAVFVAGLPTRRGLLISTRSKQPDIQVIHLQPVYGPYTVADPATQARLPPCIMGEIGQELFLLEGGHAYGRHLLDLLKDASSLAASTFGSGRGRRQMDEFYRSHGHTKKPDRDLTDPNSGYDEWTTEVGPTPIGMAYTSRFRPRYPAEIEQLTARTWVVSSLFHKDPEGSVMPGVMFELLDPGRHADIQQDIFLPSGDARFVIATLALLSDNAITTLRMAETGETGTMWRDGKQLPKYEYQVVNLIRPAEERVIELERAITAREPWNGTRYHPVEGHWCYSHRHGRDTCRHEEWTRRVEGEGVRVGQDMWKCGACGKFRWWRNPHHRGNPEIGVIERGYDVNAGMALH